MSAAHSVPSTAAYAVAAAIFAGTVGYFIGQGSSLGFFGGPDKQGSKSKKAAKSWPNNYDVTIHPDSSDEELMARLKAGGAVESDEESSDEEPSGDLASFPNNSEECKLVLVVRTDLGMGKGEAFCTCDCCPK